MISSQVTAQAAMQNEHALDNGIEMLIEESHALPLVEISFTLRTGTAHDPSHKLGLTRLCARAVHGQSGGDHAPRCVARRRCAAGDRR